MIASFVNKLSAKYNNVLTSIKNLTVKLINSSKNIIKCTWIPGHQGYELNELADQNAKQAAERCFLTKTPERSTLLIDIRESVKSKSWQFRYSNELSNHNVYNINDTVGNWNDFKIEHPLYHIINQFVTCYHSLNSHKSKITNVSPLCECGEPETVNHFVFHCEKYSRYRRELLNMINYITGKNYIKLSDFDLKTLYGQSQIIKKKQNKDILIHMLVFLEKTKRFKVL